MASLESNSSDLAMQNHDQTSGFQAPTERGRERAAASRWLLDCLLEEVEQRNFYAVPERLQML